MKWTEMDAKERGRLIVQHVMGCFILETTAKGYNTPEFPRGINAPAGFHWPIAFWNTDGECWMIEDIATDPQIFDPLCDMNAAWQVLQKAMKQGSHGYTQMTLYSSDEYLEIGVHLFDGNQSWPVVHLEGASLSASEMLCVAALRSCKVEIEVES